MRALLAQRLTDFPFERWCKLNDLHRGDAAIVSESIENLCIPWQGNHVVLPHRTLGPVYAAEAEQRAVAIYHFSADAMGTARAIGDSRRRVERVTALARTPGPRCFFEWQNHEKGLEHLTHGIYTRGNRHHYRFVRWCDNMHDGLNRPIPLCWGWFSFDALNGWMDTVEASPSTAAREELIEKLKWDTSKQVMLLWAFLASTGATVIERAPAPRGSAKHYRTRSPGAAILSFNRVRLAVPQDLIVRTETIHWEQGPGVRRHEVRAHPSFYWIGSREHPNLIVRWIAAYWRGNARLGLVLKARDVKVRS